MIIMAYKLGTNMLICQPISHRILSSIGSKLWGQKNIYMYFHTYRVSRVFSRRPVRNLLGLSNHLKLHSSGDRWLIYDWWQMTCDWDIWHMTSNLWQVTHEMWHINFWYFLCLCVFFCICGTIRTSQKNTCSGCLQFCSLGCLKISW